MVGLRSTLTVIAIGSALVARPALCQQGSSASLTHTVSVTVPARVKVQVGDFASSTQMPPSQHTASSDGLAVSVRATQAWALSIGPAKESTKIRWSTERNSGFSRLVGRDTPVASGEMSLVPAVASVFFRDAGPSGGDGSDMVTLTLVAP